MCPPSGGTKLPQPSCEDGSQTPECGVACGSIRDYSTSAVGVFGVTDRDQANLPPLVKETLCWSQKLDETFLSHKASFEASGNFPTRAELPLMYFGDEGIGLMRRFPGQYKSQCGTYDPRVRPWYFNSMSPPKDVVILIDASGSMRTGGGDAPLEHAKSAAKYLLEHFSGSDSFAVFVFGTRAVQIYPEGGGMVKGTLENTANAVGALMMDTSGALMMVRWHYTLPGIS